ncbi:hypothetical protein GCM10010230_23330 [Streptomyces narbonensis]|uniref:hypothetical protein n=1 Tax=Streptomyces narbonensis TaxID=67333 RepID=UPI00167952FD|nr:hypothetical protein [Streptomyces narbonensis]GGV98843.1 hypothetical protein GCM10010230_23330 [Streptomyces narbonensis]
MRPDLRGRSEGTAVGNEIAIDLTSAQRGPSTRSAPSRGTLTLTARAARMHPVEHRVERVR